MATSQARRISRNELKETIDRSIRGGDQLRAAGLERLMKVRAARVAGAQRDLARGVVVDAQRRARLEQQVTYDQNLMHAARLELARTRMKVPDLDEDSWTVYGYVRSADFKGVPNLMVALADARGRRLKLDPAQTRGDGYFDLTYGPARAEPAAPAAPKKPAHPATAPATRAAERAARAAERDARAPKMIVYLNIYRGSERILADTRPLMPHYGGRDHRDLFIDGGGAAPEKPGHPVRPKPDAKTDGKGASRSWGWRGKG